MKELSGNSLCLRTMDIVDNNTSRHRCVQENA